MVYTNKLNTKNSAIFWVKSDYFESFNLINFAFEVFGIIHKFGKIYLILLSK